MKKTVIGIDIGGTHITCRLFDLANNKMPAVPPVREWVDNNGSADAIINSWVAAISKLIRFADPGEVRGIGFAMPGPFDYKNGVALFDSEVKKFGNLYNINIRNELLKRLNLPAGFPLRFINDATAFAIGESWLGAAANNKRVIALTLGSGFGSTFIKNQLPVAGENGLPADGFLYHIPFENAIADDYFSTRWFINEYFRRTQKKVQGVKEIADLAASDDFAQQLFVDFGNNLGRFLVPWINQFNADCIVMGGNISKSFSLFQTEMQNQFKSTGIKISVLQSALNEEAALIGSAKLCDNQFFSKLTIYE